MKWPEIEY